MVEMEQGFYALGPYIYYGMHPRNQASYRFLMCKADPECIKTDVPFCDDDYAVRFWDNHAATQQELIGFQKALGTIMECLNIQTGRETDFEETERRLGITLPQEMKLLYSALSQCNDFTCGAERFLPLNELYIEGENLVFYKIKRTPAALSLKYGALMSYHKKQWSCSWGGENFLCYALDRLVVKAITQMPIEKKGKIKGELRDTLSPDKMLSEIFQGKFEILKEYKNDTNIILFRKDGALGWFRQNGFYSDILIGCQNETISNDLLSAPLPVDWE